MNGEQPMHHPKLNACESCLHVPSSNIVDFFNYCRSLLKTTKSCCTYSSEFIQRWLQTPLYSTIWYNVEYLSQHDGFTEKAIQVPVDVLFVYDSSPMSPVIIRIKNSGCIKIVFQYHLEDKTYLQYAGI
jgi:hypothetical protein